MTAAAAPATTASVTSQDGTTIAYDRRGSGPALIYVDGALCSRSFGPGAEVASALAERGFTTYHYDRRGRGGSGDTAPHSVDREVEDLAAVVEAAGGSACVLGVSSGAALALEAARQGVPITRLALYEAPFNADGSGTPVPDDMIARLEAALADGRRGRAVSIFMQQVGAPTVARAVMRVLPVWKQLTAVAHTLPYDIRCLGDHASGRPWPNDAFTGVAVPTLVLCGSRSPASMQTASQALARAVPGAQHRTLAGQTHMVKTAAVAPVVAEFLLDT